MKRFSIPFLAVALLCVTSFAHAQENEVLNYLSKIYRQAALSQHITRAVCEISDYKNEQKNRQFLKLAVMQIPQEGDANWKKIRFSLNLMNQIGGYPDLERELVINSGESLFASLMAQGADYISKRRVSPYAATYDRILRLETQFQKLTADMCIGKSGDRNFEIDQAIDELIFGNLEENILPAPSEELQAMLVELKENWEQEREKENPDVTIFFNLLDKVSTAYQKEYLAYQEGQ